MAFSFKDTLRTPKVSPPFIFCKLKTMQGTPKSSLVIDTHAYAYQGMSSLSLFVFGFPRGVYVKKKKMGKIKEDEPSKRKERIKTKEVKVEEAKLLKKKKFYLYLCCNRMLLQLSFC